MPGKEFRDRATDFCSTGNPVFCEVALFDSTKLTNISALLRPSYLQILRRQQMQTVADVFHLRAAAEQAIRSLVSSGVPGHSIIFVSREQSQTELKSVPSTDAERDGMGPTMGAVIGGAIGTGAGLSLGSAVASLMVPGVGPILAAGFGAAAVLGLGGAVAGGEIGNAAEKEMDQGIPRDDVFLYREFLKRGRSLVLVNFDDPDRAESVRAVLEQNGAQRPEVARDELESAA
jgi:hypothetical protein